MKLILFISLILTATFPVQSQLINPETEKIWIAAKKIYTGFHHTSYLYAVCIVADEENKHIYHDLRTKWTNEYQNMSNIVNEAVHKLIAKLGVTPTAEAVEHALNRITRPILFDVVEKLRDNPESLRKNECAFLISEGPEKLAPDPYINLSNEINLIRNYLNK